MVLDLLICNGIKILDHYSNSIESHPKDIQPEVLYIYIPWRPLFYNRLPKLKPKPLSAYKTYIMNGMTKLYCLKQQS